VTGLFITFEGGEGAGKSTQISRIRRRIEAQGHRVLVTREPGGSPRAEEIRTFLLGGKAKELGPFAEAVLFSAARMDHLERTIRPALAEGVHVLCDRFADSTMAYQSARGTLDPRVIAMLQRVAVNGTQPDLTVLLDLAAEQGLARAGRRQTDRGESSDRFESEDLAFHRALRKTFLDIANASPERCVVIDADRAPDAVEASIWSVVRGRLPELTQSPKAAGHVP
jgi:dTMP kinase